MSSDYVPSTFDDTSRRRILVVEDEPALLEMLVEGLCDEGYDVQSAASGPEALELLRSDGAGIAILVTDIRMPGMQGHELVKAARELIPGLPVLYMSGYADSPTPWAEIAEQRSDFIQKPFTVDSLCTRLAALLREAS